MSKIYKRICPECNNNIEYKHYSNYWKGKKEKRWCKRCTNAKISQNNATKISKSLKGRKLSKEHREKVVIQGKKNLVQGNILNFWIGKYGKEEAQKRHLLLKKKLSKVNSGSGNPMFGVPSPKGSGNGWSGWYKNWFFRSLRELKYVLELERDNIRWQSAENKKYQVEYLDPLGRKRTYFPDFLVEKKKIVECKPKKLWTTPGIICKVEAAKNKFDSLGLEFDLCDPGSFDETLFKELWSSGSIKLTKRYQQKALEKFGNK